MVLQGHCLAKIQRKPGSDSTFVVGRRWSLRREAGCGHWPEAIQLLKEMDSAQVRSGFGADHLLHRSESRWRNSQKVA